ncbi:MAG TPA: DNA polymerase III subunit delta [Methylothermaceae bacterium]|nr:DNA polymerase III subunit delta [Methylothermaceae bacterium]
MRIDFAQLDARLKQRVEPVYLLYGDEPLQLVEAADAIRRSCRRHGYEERQIFSVLPGFDWKELAAETDALPLFASRRLLDIRVPEGKVGHEGARVLSRYAEAPASDTVLLLILENAPAAVAKARWFQQLERRGIAVQTRALHGREFLAWLERRARSVGLHLEQDALQLLAMRTEGNLLAAAQEIDKLHVLYGAAVIDARRLARAVADSARFDVFDLTEAILLGQVQRCDRVLAGLAAEGVAPAVVIWAITRELRLLLTLLDDRRRGIPLSESCRRLRLWERRRRQLERALQRLKPADLHRAVRLAAQIDARIKGQQEGEVWPGLRDLCLGLASGTDLVDWYEKVG